jgi:hydroxypyruvate isomerase
MRYSACIDMLFQTEVPVFADRIRRAKAAGLHAVEFWQWSNRDLDAVSAALQETGLPLVGIVCEPTANITNPTTHEFFLDGVRASLEAAQRLNATLMIVLGGNVVDGAPRAAQHRAIVSCLRRAADMVAGSGVIIALEPLNDRVDHPGYFLTSTTEGLEVIDEVGRPEIAATMGEGIELLEAKLDRVAHVHL